MVAVPQRFACPGAADGADEKLAHHFEAGEIEPDEGVGAGEDHEVLGIFEAAEIAVEGPSIGTRGDIEFDETLRLGVLDPVGSPEDGVVADIGDTLDLGESLGDEGFACAAGADDDDSAAGAREGMGA